MTDDLREKIARRVYKLGDPRLIADECVRLMEWARRECISLTPSWDGDRIERDALTLPPDDWRP